MASATPEILYHDLQACNSFDFSTRLADINIPTLVICRTVDKMKPLRLSNHLTSSIPEAQLEAIPNARHMAMLEQPGAVAASMAIFLSSIDL